MCRYRMQALHAANAVQSRRGSSTCQAQTFISLDTQSREAGAALQSRLACQITHQKAACRLAEAPMAVGQPWYQPWHLPPATLLITLGVETAGCGQLLTPTAAQSSPASGFCRPLSDRIRHQPAPRPAPALLPVALVVGTAAPGLACQWHWWLGQPLLVAPQSGRSSRHRPWPAAAGVRPRRSTSTAPWFRAFPTALGRLIVLGQRP